jgi:hypothetical protein
VVSEGGTVAKKTFISTINNLPLYAERAKETTTGRDIDSTLDGKQDQMTEMTSQEIDALVNELN